MTEDGTLCNLTREIFVLYPYTLKSLGDQGSQGVADGRDPDIRAYQEKLVEPNSRAGNNSFIYLD